MMSPAPMARPMAHTSEAPVGAASRGGDFREVYDAEHDFVWRSLVHLGVPTAHADDALQEVFIVVHRRLEELDPALPLRAWLWGIARNVAHNARRSLGREARRRHELSREPHDTTDDSLERAPEVAAVREVLLSMDEMFRDVLVLSDIEGMTALEIAAALGAKTNTVYSRLRIARAKFAEEMARRGHAPGSDA
jgi:RNA polymerase sigma-70 factor, ECF subfamily